MKKKTAILLAGTMIASTILAGCGSKEEGAANQVASEELKGDITFWHSFTQGPRLEVIQETADHDTGSRTWGTTLRYDVYPCNFALQRLADVGVTLCI